MAKVSRNLSEYSDKEMVSALSQAVSDLDALGSFEQTGMKMSLSSPQSGLFEKRMGQYIGMLRCMQLWYHSAHHVTRGAGFSGDHPELYGSFYSKLGEEADAAIEKAIGISNNEEMGCPKHITGLALQVMNKYPSPSKMTSLAIASTALQMENDYQELIKAVFTELESAQCLSLGLNDFLMANANDHESHIYKLQQRVKTELED